MDSAISRVSAIADDYDYTCATSGPIDVQSYSYLGLDTIVNKLDGNGVELTYTTPGGETGIADGGDQYKGLDRFGRVIDQNWYDTGATSSNERFQYGYDQDGNVLYKNNIYAPTFSELYHANSASSGDNSSAYDPLGRLQAFRRGTLSSSGNNGPGLDKVSTGDVNTVASDNTATYSLDALGNQAAVNSKNQLTATHVAYDHNGNMTEDGSENTFVYDAWNRLVGGSQLGHDYAYDAFGRRVAYGMDNIEDRNDYYYSADGHNIEDHYCNGITAQYVWGLGGPNELILRDSTLTTNTGGLDLGTAESGLTQRLYAEQDANENVTALVGPTGTVAEHFVYGPYGSVQVMNGTYSATATDTNEWVYLYQGGRLDPATGFYKFGARDYNPATATWIEPEPFGGAYVDGANLYQSFLSNPLKYVDPSGFDGVSSTQATTQPATAPATQTDDELMDGLRSDDWRTRHATRGAVERAVHNDPGILKRLREKNKQTTPEKKDDVNLELDNADIWYNDHLNAIAQLKQKLADEDEMINDPDIPQWAKDDWKRRQPTQRANLKHLQEEIGLPTAPPPSTVPSDAQSNSLEDSSYDEDAVWCS